MKQEGVGYITPIGLVKTLADSYNLPDTHFHPEFDTANSTPVENVVVSEGGKQSGNNTLRLIISKREIQRYQRIQEIKKQYKQNKRLQKKLNRALELTHGFIEQHNLLKRSNEVTKVRPLKRHSSLSKRKNPYAKGIVLQKTILLEMRKWEVDDSFSARKLLSAIEEYKSYTKHIIDKYKEKNIESVIVQAKRNAHNFNKGESRKDKRAKKPHNDVGSEEAKKVWKRLSVYFSLCCPELIGELLQVEERELNFPQTLNLFAVNRFAAVLKMILYCQTNSLPFKDFHEGRVSQKIRGWHKMAKIAAAAHGTSLEAASEKASYTDNKGVYYPLLDELGYLSSIAGQLPEEVVRLKALLQRPAGECRESGEETLREAALENRVRLKGVLRRVGNEREKGGETVPAAKRTHVHHNPSLCKASSRNEKKKLSKLKTRKYELTPKL